MMTEDRRAAVLERVANIIRTGVKRPDEVISERTTARDVPGWDSLAHINVIVAVESEFALKLKSSEVARVQDVAGLIDIILERGRI